MRNVCTPQVCVCLCLCVFVLLLSEGSRFPNGSVKPPAYLRSCMNSEPNDSMTTVFSQHLPQFGRREQNNKNQAIFLRWDQPGIEFSPECVFKAVTWHLCSDLPGFNLRPPCIKPSVRQCFLPQRDKLDDNLSTWCAWRLQLQLFSFFLHIISTGSGSKLQEGPHGNIKYILSISGFLFCQKGYSYSPLGGISARVMQQNNVHAKLILQLQYFQDHRACLDSLLSVFTHISEIGRILRNMFSFKGPILWKNPFTNSF